MSVAALDAGLAGRLDRIAQLRASVLGGGVAAPAAAPAVASAPTAAPATSTSTAAPTSFASLLGQAKASAAAPAATLVGGSAQAQGLPFGAEIDQAAQRNGVPPLLLAGLVRQESGFDPTARSAAGAVGLTQLMPATAAGLGVQDPTDPAQSLEGGAKYLRQQLDHFGGDQAKALAAYNAGPGAVERFGGVPPYAETQHYVQAILGGLGSRT